MANTNNSTARSDLPFDGPLLRMLGDNWWLVLLRGVAAIIFGVLALFWPGITILTLALLWGAYMLVDGVFSLWAAISGRGVGQMTPRWWLAVSGIISVLAGIAAFISPAAVALVLLIFIGAWAIVVGALTVWGAIQMRKEIEGEWLLGLFGVLTILFGILVIWQPATGALSLIWAIGGYAIASGILLIVLAFRLRKLRKA